jgi:hypothetical protein
MTTTKRYIDHRPATAEEIGKLLEMRRYPAAELAAILAALHRLGFDTPTKPATTPVGTAWKAASLAARLVSPPP